MILYVLIINYSILSELNILYIESAIHYCFDILSKMHVLMVLIWNISGFISICIRKVENIYSIVDLSGSKKYCFYSLEFIITEI